MMVFLIIRLIASLFLLLGAYKLCGSGFLRLGGALAAVFVLILGLQIFEIAQLRGILGWTQLTLFMVELLWSVALLGIAAFLFSLSKCHKGFEAQGQSQDMREASPKQGEGGNGEHHGTGERSQ